MNCLALLLGLTVMTLGCGPQIEKGVIVKGKILKAGQPLKVANREVAIGSIQVTLIPDFDGDGWDTEADDDGNFEILGREEKYGITPGKYKLVVINEENGFDTGDTLKGEFNEENSPITLEVPADKTGDTHDFGTIELDDYLKK